MTLNRFVPAYPRGSVLIFALILLILLAGIGTMFMLTAQLEGHATSNSLKNSQADEAVEAGLVHARQAIFQGVNHYQPVSPDGIFINDSAKGFIDIDCNKTSGTANPNFSYFRMFEGYDSEKVLSDTLTHPISPSDLTGHAWLWWNYNDGPAAFFQGLSETRPRRVFTDRKATIFNWPSGTKKIFMDGGPEHAGQARKFIMGEGFNGSNWDDIYTLPKSPGRVPMMRGEYCIWVDDLDAKLYYDPKLWGLTPALGDAGMAKDIVDSICTASSMTPLSDVSATKLWDISKTSKCASTAELFKQLQGLVGGSYASTQELFYSDRYGLDRYFTVTPETTSANGKYIKENAYSLNINTANPEVIAAALCRVPLAFLADGTPNPSQNATKAKALAARICAMRPFTGRTDFEDFLAAHINNDPTVSPDAISTTVPIDPTNAAQATPVSYIYQAIGKRQSVNVNALNNQMIYMGLDPSVIDTTSLAANIYLQNTAVNTAMQTRFAFFRTDSTVAPLTDALINMKAFNNILNSTSGRLEGQGFAAGSSVINTTTPCVNGFPVVFDSNASTTVPAGLRASVTYYAHALTQTQASLHYTQADAIAGSSAISFAAGGSGKFNVFPFSYYSSGTLKIFRSAAAGPTDTVVPLEADLPFTHVWAAAASENYDVFPKVIYSKLTNADITNPGANQTPTGTVTYGVTGTGAAGDLIAWYPTNTSGYYEFYFKAKTDEQHWEFGQTVPHPIPDANVIVVKGTDTTQATKESTDDTVSGVNVVDPAASGNKICDTSIHGPLRTYRQNTLDLATVAPSTAKTDGVNLDGDVAWSPRFDFRSRYFMIYVLANDLRADKSGIPSPGNFRRVEALYDALADKVLWRRSPISEKRALGNP